MRPKSPRLLSLWRGLWNAYVRVDRICKNAKTTLPNAPLKAYHRAFFHLMTSGIRLGLERVSRLIANRPQPWSAVHVAGTNGKGSVCAYISAMLQHVGIRTGRFTSPHLIDRWDCISVNERVVDKDVFEEAEFLVKARDKLDRVGASNFEILTATAFEIFRMTRMDIAVVECGMGGRYDATNVLQKPLVTAITQVGLDHQDHLGSSMEDVAHHKAGIVKPGVPCVTWPSIDSRAKCIIEAETRALKAPFHLAPMEIADDFNNPMNIPESHNSQNVSLACSTVEQVLISLKRKNSHMIPDELGFTEIRNALAATLLNFTIPGRMQMFDLEHVTGRRAPVLIDGAHNADAWRELSKYVAKCLRVPKNSKDQRQDAKSVTWVLAQSGNKHKSLTEMIQILCRPGDTVFMTGFGAVDGMAWVKPAAYEDVDFRASFIRELGGLHICSDKTHTEVLTMASDAAREGPMVISGSLYLVSDVLRLLRDHGLNIYEGVT